MRRLTIWHSADEDEVVRVGGSETRVCLSWGRTGAVSARGEIRPTELVRYELTLALSGWGGDVSRRGLAVELTPLLLSADE